MILSTKNPISTLDTQIKWLISFFIVGLILSGLTAFPIEWELRIANLLIQHSQINNNFSQWFESVYTGVVNTNKNYPFIAYGTDWLAFAHLVIALLFIGPWKDPIKNKWVIEWGMLACIAIFPLAFIAGTIRGIPVYWRFVDCSFGVIGGLILFICYLKIKKKEKAIILP